MRATGRILPVDFSLPVSARKVRPGLITRESFHIHGRQPSPKSPDLGSQAAHFQAGAARMGRHTDDVLAMGDYSIIALNPVFAS